MNIQSLIQLFRTQVSDEAPPFLWPDDEVLQYVIDAQDMFVRKIGGITGMTVTAASDPDSLELHDLVLTVDAPYTSFSPYILRTRSIRLVTAKKDVKVISEADFSNSILVMDYGLVSPMFLDDTVTGPITHAIIGLKERNFRWYKVPATADTARLHFYRLPYPRIVDQEDNLEIEEQHHIHLLKWVKASAYNKEDGETYDKGLVDKNEAAFDKYCETARQELDRQRFKPRVIQYQGL